MNVLKRLKQSTGITFILITHDIATSSELADFASIMYAGRCGYSDAEHFFTKPLHPCGEADGECPHSAEDKELDFIPGQPQLINPQLDAAFMTAATEDLKNAGRNRPWCKWMNTTT